MNSPFSSLKWRNITISGKAASGATTLSKKLAEKLNWRLINGGELVRNYMKKRGFPLEFTTKTPNKFHLELDNLIKEKLRTEKRLIIESWLAGFNAQNIPKVFKIFVNCSDDAVRIDRLVNRDNMTIEEAKKHLKTREEENTKKWKMLYGNNDFWRKSYFDLIIDTYENGPSETLDITLRKIGYYEK